VPPPPTAHPLSLHDALPILLTNLTVDGGLTRALLADALTKQRPFNLTVDLLPGETGEELSVLSCAKILNIKNQFSREYGEICGRSEEHTSELQSRFDLVCRL